MSLMKKFLFAASVLLLSKNTFASDCSELVSVIGYLGNDFKNTYKTDDCCTFNGVTCDNDKHVTGIKFNNINGSQSNVHQVFETLANLKYLTSLDLSGNGFSGYLPYGITKLTNLKSLDLSNNKFNGTIPYDTRDLEKLEQFNINGNSDLYGYVPMKNIKTCSYQSTNICNLPNAICKTASRDCTLNDINKTNEFNGYPTQTSADRSVTDSKDRATNVYYDDYVYGGYGDYYNNNGYGYTGNGYDNSGYGYTGNGYDTSGYGYTGNGYDNSGYGYSGYDNSYGNSYGYGSTGFTPNLIEDNYGSSLSDLFKSLLGLVLFALLAFICCLCCICRTCCGSGSTSGASSTIKPFGGLYQTNHNTTTVKPTKPNKPLSTTINIDNEPNPYASQDITNINTHSNYSMPTPNGYQQNVYPPPPPQGQMNYGNPFFNGAKREVEEEVKKVEVKTEEKK